MFTAPFKDFKKLPTLVFSGETTWDERFAMARLVTIRHTVHPFTIGRCSPGINLGFGDWVRESGVGSGRPQNAPQGIFLFKKKRILGPAFNDRVRPDDRN